jgi:hypothetical protein
MMTLLFKDTMATEEFKAGAKAMFDYILFRAANNYHSRADIQILCNKENKLVTEWITDALEEVSPDSAATWQSIDDAYATGYRTGVSDTKPKTLTNADIKRILVANGFKTYAEAGDDLKPYCYKAIRAIEAHLRGDHATD